MSYEKMRWYLNIYQKYLKKWFIPLCTAGWITLFELSVIRSLTGVSSAITVVMVALASILVIALLSSLRVYYALITYKK